MAVQFSGNKMPGKGKMGQNTFHNFYNQKLCLRCCFGGDRRKLRVSSLVSSRGQSGASTSREATPSDLPLRTKWFYSTPRPSYSDVTPSSGIASWDRLMGLRTASTDPRTASGTSNGSPVTALLH